MAPNIPRRAKPTESSASSASISAADAGAGEEASAEFLLQTLPWGVVVLDVHNTVLRVNQQAADWWGIAQQSLQGRRLEALPAGALPADLQQALTQVTSERPPPPGTFFLPTARQWVAMASARQADNWLVYWQSVPAPESRERAASVLPSPRLTEARYRSLFMTMEQGFCLIEKVDPPPGVPSDYRFVAVNPAFERHSGLLDATGHTLRQLVPGVEPHIVAAYDDTLASGAPRHFEEYVADLDVWITAEILPDPQPGHLAVLFSNVTARHQAEQALRENDARQSCLLALNDALQAVVDASEIQAITARLLGEHLGANQVHYGEIRGEHTHVYQGYGNSLPSLTGRFRTLDYSKRLTAAHRAGSVQVVADIETSASMSKAERATWRQAHIGAYITHRAPGEGGPVGSDAGCAQP